MVRKVIRYVQHNITDQIADRWESFGRDILEGKIVVQRVMFRLTRFWLSIAIV